MIFGIFEDFAQLLEVIGVWLAALATFSAAFIALRIANHANSQKVRVVARPMVMAFQGRSDPFQNIFMISATNLGLRPVTILGVVVTSPWPRFSAVFLKGDQGSSKLPITLNGGEAATWTYAETGNGPSNVYRRFAEDIQGKGRLYQWFLVRNLRFSVETSLGNRIFAPPSNGFRKKVFEQIREVRKQ